MKRLMIFFAIIMAYSLWINFMVRLFQTPQPTAAWISLFCGCGIGWSTAKHLFKDME